METGTSDSAINGTGAVTATCADVYVQMRLILMDFSPTLISISAISEISTISISFLFLRYSLSLIC